MCVCPYGMHAAVSRVKWPRGNIKHTTAQGQKFSIRSNLLANQSPTNSTARSSKSSSLPSSLYVVFPPLSLFPVYIEEGFSFWTYKTKRGSQWILNYGLSLHRHTVDIWSNFLTFNILSSPLSPTKFPIIWYTSFGAFCERSAFSLYLNRDENYDGQWRSGGFFCL